MLTLFSFHSQLSLQIEANGDTEVDDHHVTEDIGIVLGQLLLEMVKDRTSFKRYGHSYILWMKHYHVPLSILAVAPICHLMPNLVKKSRNFRY